MVCRGNRFAQRPEPAINCIVEQRQVVGAHVEHHGKHPVRVDPDTSVYTASLPIAIPHPAHTLIPNPEDALRVGGHQQVRRRGLLTSVWGSRSRPERLTSSDRHSTPQA
jgi:hypothetical protein